jgi:DNA polymerase I-like protein with 3'-5' exonuclease and polymerase domains
MLAIDTETTGLDPWHGCKPFYVSTCSDKEEIKCWEWDVNPKTREPIIPPKDIADLNDYIRSHRVRPRVVDNGRTGGLVFHNAKFDIRMLKTIGVDLTDLWEHIDDTLIASHVLWSNEPHGLKELALLHLDVTDRDEKNLHKAVKDARTRAKQFGWNQAKDNHPHWPGLHRKEFWGFDFWVPRAVAKVCKMSPDHPWHTILAKYAQCDAERTMGLWLLFEEMLREAELEEQYETRRSLLRITYKMEQRGVSLNRSNLLAGIRDCAKRGRVAERRCRRYATIDNLNSPKQIQRVLFTDFGLEPVRKTKTGWSTDADTIDALLATTDPASIPHKFLKNFKEVAKCETDYGHLTSYKDFSAGSHYLHSSINITGTRTTRFSTERPNTQNPDRNTREVFGPRPGRWWLKADYANIELRMLAYAAGETELIQAFERGESVHMNFAWIICPWAILDCPRDKSKEYYQRQKAKLPPKKRKELEDTFKLTDQYHFVKNGDFALTYGATRNTADITYHIDGAYDMVMGYFHELKRYTRTMIEQAYRHHCVTTLGGYNLQIPHGREPTTAVDYYCQGSAGWIITEAMINCQAYLDDYNYCVKDKKQHAYIIMQIHDELDFDIPEGFDRKHMDALFTLMEAPGSKYGVPTPIEPMLIKVDWSKGEKLQWNSR